MEYLKFRPTERQILGARIRDHYIQLPRFRDILLVKFTDQPGTVALYVSSRFLGETDKGLAIMPEVEGIKRAWEQIDLGYQSRQQIRTQEVTFNRTEDFREVVTSAAEDFFGSKDAARPFLSSLDGLQP